MRQLWAVALAAFLLGAVLTGYSVDLYWQMGSASGPELPVIDGTVWTKALVLGKPGYDHVDLAICPPDGALGPMLFTAKDHKMYEKAEVGRLIPLALKKEGHAFSEGWSYDHWAKIEWTKDESLEQ